MARIPEAEIERLKNEVSVERLVASSGIALKKSGKDLLGTCPFHDDAELVGELLLREVLFLPELRDAPAQLLEEAFLFVGHDVRYRWRVRCHELNPGLAAWALTIRRNGVSCKSSCFYQNPLDRVLDGGPIHGAHPRSRDRAAEE